MAFLRAFFLVFLGGALVLAAGNYGLDADGRWHQRFRIEQQVAAIVLSGRHVQTNANFSLQKVQRLILDGQPHIPDTVIIGSSRVMAVRAEFVQAPSFLNHGMPSAGLLDMIGILSSYDKRGALPRNIILGVDPWVAKRQRMQGTRLAPFADHAQTFASRIPLHLAELGWQAESLWTLFSTADLRSNLQVLFRSTDPCGDVKARDDDHSPCAVRRPDGSLKWSDTQEYIDAQTMAEEAHLALSKRGRLHGFDGFDHVDDKSLAAFAALLRHLQAQGSQVSLMLHPYYPAVPQAQRMRGDWALVTEIESRIRAIAAPLGITVHGSYDPKIAGCGTDEFIDLDHAKGSCLARILAPMRSGFTAPPQQ